MPTARPLISSVRRSWQEFIGFSITQGTAQTCGFRFGLHWYEILHAMPIGRPRHLLHLCEIARAQTVQVLIARCSEARQFGFQKCRLFGRGMETSFVVAWILFLLLLRSRQMPIARPFFFFGFPTSFSFVSHCISCPSIVSRSSTSCRTCSLVISSSLTWGAVGWDMQVCTDAGMDRRHGGLTIRWGIRRF